MSHCWQSENGLSDLQRDLSEFANTKIGERLLTAHSSSLRQSSEQWIRSPDSTSLSKWATFIARAMYFGMN